MWVWYFILIGLFYLRNKLHKNIVKKKKKKNKRVALPTMSDIVRPLVNLPVGFPPEGLKSMP